MKQELLEKLGLAQTPTSVDFQIQYSHTDTHMYMHFGRMVDNLSFTPAQLDDMEKVLGDLRVAFFKHGDKRV